MIELLIIADDFTGALDTGIQFVDSGVSTQIVTDSQYDLKKIPDDVAVLVVDSETRHESQEKAYKTVRQIAFNAAQAGIPHIYKKTDSALRGNIGSELQAVLDGTGGKRLHYIPALPAMGRVTVDGTQYINEIPVAESAFREDPFNPVKYSKVKELIASQTKSPVFNHQEYEAAMCEGIHVYDAATDLDMMRIAQQLKDEGELALTAGCAGFASVLPDPLGLEGALQQEYNLQDAMLVVCGSTNPVSQEQITCAENSGFMRFSLKPSQKLNPEWIESVECQQMIDAWKYAIENKKKFILDANDTKPGETQRYARALGLSTEALRVGVSDMLGALLKKMLDQGANGTLFLTGGDTLLAFMKQISVKQLNPICEMAPGVVLSQVRYKNKEYYMISKSGGFGNRTLISDLAGEICSGA